MFNIHVNFLKLIRGVVRAPFDRKPETLVHRLAVFTHLKTPIPVSIPTNNKELDTAVLC